MKKLITAVITIACFACTMQKHGDKSLTDIIKPEAFDTIIDGKKVALYILENNNGIKAYFTNYGARIVSLHTPDKDGDFKDIVLGFDKIDPYIEESMYLGCIVGRFANRISKAKFTLDGEEYHLSKNDGLNTLHGGEKGFDKRVWDAGKEGNTLTFSYLSPDGEEGYPGNLKVKKSYTLTDDNELKIAYEAETDKRTVINLSHHSYFNLKGEGDTTILDHFLQINADYYIPVDNTLIPTGELLPVADTPFDFTTAKQIGRDIEIPDIQLTYGLGYDHNWVLNKNPEDTLIFTVKLWEESSGRVLEIYTSEPGIQFYSGNFMDGSVTGKSGKLYKYRAGLALETQHFPDSPNQPDFPSTVLIPGEKYMQLCVLKFDVTDK